MVATFVALMFVGFILLDLVLQTIEARRAALARCARLQAEGRALASGSLWQIPQGFYLTEHHAWLKPDPAKGLLTGADALVAHSVGAADEVILPKLGDRVKAGQPLFLLARRGCALTIPSALTGKVVAVNARLKGQPELVAAEPYGAGWVCVVMPTGLNGGPKQTRFGEEAAFWLQREFERFREFLVSQVSPDLGLGATSLDGGFPAAGSLDQLGPGVWTAFELEFLRSREE